MAERHLKSNGQGRFGAVSSICEGRGLDLFFLCCLALWDMRKMRQAGRPWPRHIDFRITLAACKAGIPQAGSTDVFRACFQQTAGELSAAGRLPFVDHHGLYAFLDYRRINPVVQHYFQPSEQALALEAEWVEHHRIDPASTLAVLYPGTDEGPDVQRASPLSFLALARQLLNRNPDHRLLIQTDDRDVRDQFCAAFGERCFYLSELPLSEERRAAQAGQNMDLGLSDSDRAVLRVAVLHLLARCNLVINHTGSTALWLCLFRGHSRGVWQFDDEGHAVNPMRPGAWFGAWRRLAKKARRRLLG